MIPDPQDTIVALASASGPGRRSVIRLSGPRSLAAVQSIQGAGETPLPPRRCFHQGHIQLQAVAAPLPADLYFWPAPKTYTGQDIAEIHTLSCPPLIDLLIAQLLTFRIRAAAPGEFTLRAFLVGKLDLPRAEAVLGVIEAVGPEELKQALTQLAGGVTRPLEGLREDLLNFLADVEAELDFAEEDIQVVSQEQKLLRLAKGLAQVTLVKKQLEKRSVRGRPFRVVLTGQPNVGKSSLFNSLAGVRAALTSPEPGTTRDYLSRTLRLDDVNVEVVDTAGWQEAGDPIEAEAQALGRHQADQADLLLLCLEAGRPLASRDRTLLESRGRPAVLAVWTKSDSARPDPNYLATSAVTGTGLAELRAALAEQARSQAQPTLAPSLSRCEHHIDACLEHLRRAHATVLFEDPGEILALELRDALDQLGEMVGAVYTDDLLERIFSRFCIGK